MANGIKLEAVNRQDGNVTLRRSVETATRDELGQVVGTFWIPRAEWEEFLSNAISGAVNTGADLVTHGLELGDRDTAQSALEQEGH